MAQPQYVNLATGQPFEELPGAPSFPYAAWDGSQYQMVMVDGSVVAVSTLAADLAGKVSNPMTSLGDIIAAGAAGAPGRLAIGSGGQVLTVTGGVPAWAAAAAGAVAPDNGNQVYNVKNAAYGAKGDEVDVGDGAMTLGSGTFNCATSLPFTSTAVDAGKVVNVYGAQDRVGTAATLTSNGTTTITDTSILLCSADIGKTVTSSLGTVVIPAATTILSLVNDHQAVLSNSVPAGSGSTLTVQGGGILQATVSTVASPGTATLSVVAVRTVSNANAQIGHDDTAACQGAINAALQALAAGTAGAVVYFPPGAYLVQNLNNWLAAVSFTSGTLELQGAGIGNTRLVASGTGFANGGKGPAGGGSIIGNQPNNIPAPILSISKMTLDGAYNLIGVGGVFGYRSTGAILTSVRVPYQAGGSNWTVLAGTGTVANSTTTLTVAGAPGPISGLTNATLTPTTGTPNVLGSRVVLDWDQPLTAQIGYGYIASVVNTGGNDVVTLTGSWIGTFTGSIYTPVAASGAQQWYVDRSSNRGYLNMARDVKFMRSFAYVSSPTHFDIDHCIMEDCGAPDPAEPFHQDTFGSSGSTSRITNATFIRGAGSLADFQPSAGQFAKLIFIGNRVIGSGGRQLAAAGPGTVIAANDFEEVSSGGIIGYDGASSGARAHGSTMVVGNRLGLMTISTSPPNSGGSHGLCAVQGDVIQGNLPNNLPLAGALSTKTFVSTTGAQVSLLRDVIVVVPLTLTTVAGTCLVEVSPDNVTYSALATATPGVNGSVTMLRVDVPCQWWVRFTTANATLGTATWY